MSTAYELIAESLNEIISDLEETGGENLKREKKSAAVEFRGYMNCGEKMYSEIDEYVREPISEQQTAGR